MLALAFTIQVAIMVGASLGLWFWLRRHWAVSWGLIGAGAVGFIGSQVVHIPIVIGLTLLFKLPGMPHAPTEWKPVINGVVLGLLAGLCEEPARYAVMRWWKRDARGWRGGIALGAGHGGVESLILGIVVVVNLVGVVLISRHWIPLPEGVAEKIQPKIAEVLGAPPWKPLLGGAERIFAILDQLAMSAMVMQCFARQKLWPLWLAVAWHTIIDGVSVYLVAKHGVGVTEGWVAVSAGASVALLVWSRRVFATAEPITR
jgi:uncharacterized membrane protein YhfC